MNVLVTHPGRQHSHQLAQALYEQGSLAGYWTGVPAANPDTKGVLYQAVLRFTSQAPTNLPSRVVEHNYVEPLARRLLRPICSPARTTVYGHYASAWFDAWTAHRMPKKLDAVVCYENAARDTFEAARKQNVTTILDAASFHHEWQDAFHEPMESDKAHAAINRRKDEEVELADHILTVSEFARQSYIDAGVAPEHVTSVPVGADLSVFKPDINKEKEGMKPFTFLFAGHAGRRKGVDVLLEASEYLSRDEYNHQIQFAGGADDGLFDDTDAPVERLGYLSAPDLAAAFRQSDVLVLPSRHDSFGRVVVEAMATGLTAIVSEHVGAKEAITQGKTGWIVPAEDAEALAEQMRWCVEHQEQVRGMRPAAIASAQGYSWSAYRERVSDIIVSVARQ